MKLAVIVVPGLCRLGTGFFSLKLWGTPEAVLQSHANAVIFLAVILGYSAVFLPELSPNQTQKWHSFTVIEVKKTNISPFFIQKRQKINKYAAPNNFQANLTRT